MAGSDFAAHTADVWTITSTGGTADWGDPGGRAVLSTNENDDANDLALRSDGKIVVAGSHYSPTDSKLQAYRLTSDGLLDHSFSGNGKATVDPSKTGVTTSTVWTPQVLVRPDNRTVYVGGLNQNNGSFLNSLLVAGLTPKGKPDKVFGKHVYDGLSETWGDAALERDGKLVVAGFVPPNPSTQNAVARVGRKGKLDTSWSGDGILPLNESSDTIALGITPEGRVIVGRTLGSGPYDAELRALRGTRTPSCAASSPPSSARTSATRWSALPDATSWWGCAATTPSRASPARTCCVATPATTPWSAGRAPTSSSAARGGTRSSPDPEQGRRRVRACRSTRVR